MIDLNSNDDNLLDNIDPDDNFINVIYPGLTTEGSQYYSVNNVKNVLNGRDFEIIHSNIRSFNKNFDSFLAVLSSINAVPDVFVLSETWLSEPVHVEGYNSFHTVRDGRRSGGVSVFVKDLYVCDVLSEFSLSNDTIESCTVRITIGKIDLVIVGIYRPHIGRIMEFCESLGSLLSSSELSKDVCVLGDLNINLLNQENSDVMHFSALMRSFQFLPTITKPTRLPFSNLNQQPSLIDHIWTKFSFNYCNHTGILLDNTTDHCTTFLTISKHLLLSDSCNDLIEMKFRLVDGTTIEEFNNHINSVDWNSLIDNGDVNIVTNRVVDTINGIYCRSFPLKIKRVSRKRICNPWLTSEIMKYVKMKSLHFKSCKLGLISDTDYKKIRNHVNRIVSKAKCNYYKERFSRRISDLKKTWKDIRKLISVGDSKMKINSILNDGAILSDENDIAQCFNSHFCTIGAKIESSLPVSPNDPLSHVIRNVHSFYLEPVTQDEVVGIIGSLRSIRCDINSISVYMLKFSQNILSYPISLLINKSFLEGIFPDVFKRADVIPVYKKGDKKDINNYRPISLLPLFSKIYERCIANRVLCFVTRFSLISKEQFGFRKGLSTVDAMIDYSAYICRELEKRNHIVGVFIDYCKAFDTVKHDILLAKLEAYGIRGIALKWFASYLGNRVQRVRIGQSYSDYQNVNVGVPQGSVLGPLLFIFYVNDLPNVSASLKSILFADDTTVSSSGYIFSDLCSTVNDELESVHRWSVSNRLSLNSDKTAALIFTNRRNDEIANDCLVVNGTNINVLECVKFLGVHLDNRLTFKNHINAVCGKLSKVVGILYKLKECLSPKSLINMYYNLFYPYLTYGNVLWGGTYGTHLNTIEMLQKRAIRIITGSEYLSHTEPLFLQTSILKFEDLHKYLLLLYYFKHKCDFQPSNVNYSTRYGGEPILYAHRLTLTEHSVLYSAARLWRSLSEDLKNINSYAVFKKKLKLHYLSQYVSL